MTKNALLRLQSFGQSVWVDFLHRGMIASGELEQLIQEDGLGGVINHPGTFKQKIAYSDAYDDAMRALLMAGKRVDEVYHMLMIEDVQRAADLFQDRYYRSEGKSGFVSLDISPHLAYNAQNSIKEARTLWGEINRPNLMIKVPATTEGLTVIQELISEGLNVNVNHIFGLERYCQVAEAYLVGLETRQKAGLPLTGVASVASFSLSSIDAIIDPLLERKLETGQVDGKRARLVKNQVGIATAKLAYQEYLKIFKGERFNTLAGRGASPQWLLWGSSKTRNPAYSDLKYINALIGPETINAVTLEAFKAYRKGGYPVPRLVEHVAVARRILKTLSKMGIDIKAITRQLEEEAIHKLIVPYSGETSRKLDEKLQVLSAVAPT